MRPSVKLTDHLIKRQVGRYQSAHDLIWRHAGHLEVSRIAQTVLAGVLAAYAVVDLLGSEGAVNHNWLAVQQRLDLL